MSEVKIRRMVEDDKEFIISLATRFTDFEFMSWRDPEAMKAAQVKLVKEAVENPNPESDIFVVEDASRNLLGFLHVIKNTDFFTSESQGYVSSIAVSKEGEGKGIAKKLMQKAEDWSKSKGYKQLVLNVFASNERAIHFYSHLNYETEIVKMVKEL